VLTVAIGLGDESVEGCAKHVDDGACSKQKRQASVHMIAIDFIDIILRFQIVRSNSPGLHPGNGFLVGVIGELR
jgi:hypothetical protein